MRRRLQLAVAVLSLTMFVGACGGGGDDDEPEVTTTVAASATTAAPATTVADDDNALARLPEVFKPIPGYVFIDLPDSILEDLQDEFASDPDTAEAVAAADGRSVTRNGDPAGSVIAIGFDERSAVLPGFEAGFIGGATEDAVTTKDLKLSGEDVKLGVDGDGLVTIVWFKGTLALLIIGDDEATVTPVATALIASNKAGR